MNFRQEPQDKAFSTPILGLNSEVTYGNLEIKRWIHKHEEIEKGDQEINSFLKDNLIHILNITGINLSNDAHLTTMLFRRITRIKNAVKTPGALGGTYGTYGTQTVA